MPNTSSAPAAPPPGRPREKTYWPLGEFSPTPGVRVLCRGQTFQTGHYGIVTVGKLLFAFHDDGPDAVALVPVNYWELEGAPIRVCRVGPELDQVAWSAGRWRCMYPGCKTHGGLLHATDCPHVKAAELIEWHGWNHDPSGGER